LDSTIASFCGDAAIQLLSERGGHSASRAYRIGFCTRPSSVPKYLQTAFLGAFTGRALTIFRAGLALNTVGSLVKGLMPFRALVAGFLTTTNFARPGTTNVPDFLSSLWAVSARPSRRFLTFFLLSPSEPATSFSISCVFDSIVSVLVLSRAGGK